MTQALQQQHHPGRPALRARVQLVELGVGERDVARSGDAGALFVAQAQLVPSHDADAPARAQGREARRRIGAAQDEDAPTLGQLVHRHLHDVLVDGVAEHVLVVIEHQVGRIAAEQLAEEPAREGLDVAEVAGLERRQRRRAPVRARRLGKIVEPGSDVGIAAVDLVPQAVQSAPRRVVRNQRGLARTRRPRDPHHRRVRVLIEEFEQPRTRKRRPPGRPGQLGEAGGATVHAG